MPYTWLHEVPTIWDRHGPETLRAEAGEDMPEKIVFVECGAPWRKEVQWVEELAAAEPRIAAIVAHLEVNAGEQTTAGIAELKKHSLVRSVRQNFEHERDSNYCTTPGFLAGVKALGAAGLSFDICCKPRHLPAVIEMVKRCPGTSFILDHAAKPEIRAGILDPWRADISTLAQLPNIVCKFSGLVTEADHHAWTVAHLRPYITHLLETFGPRRLLFGGDWPVARLATEYPRWLEVARTVTSRLFPADQVAIFHDNAARVYRIA